jgi:DNA primase
MEAGLTLPKSSPDNEVREAKRATLYDVMEAAAGYFQSMLFSKEGSAALDYLRQRGLTDTTIKEFRIGYAPNSRNALRVFLADKGIAVEQMAAAGLLVAGEDVPVAYDRFRDRIMFPIEDSKGRPIAFGGRALSAEALAKYLNSPETELFDKGSTLFSLARARKPAFESGKIVVVEGYMDVAAAFQEGFTNVVAALGTALTESHVKQLWRLAPDPVLCFDGDKAGYQAASRALDRAMPLFLPGHSLRFAFLPENKDPADLMIEGRQQDFTRYLDDAISAIEYFWRKETSGVPIDTPEKKAALESKIALAVRAVQAEQVRKHYQMAMRIRLSDLFWSHDRTQRRKLSRQSVITLPPSYETERIILGLAVEFPEIVFQDIELFQKWHLRSEAHQAFQQELVRLLIELEDKTVTSVYLMMKPEFYRVLEQVHGREKVQGKSVLPRGHALYQRFPIARYDPPRNFIIRYFELLSRGLELESVILDRDEALAQFEIAMTESNERRLLNIMKEIEYLRTLIVNEEKELTEEAGQIAEAFRTNQENNRASRRRKVGTAAA